MNLSRSLTYTHIIFILWLFNQSLYGQSALEKKIIIPITKGSTVELLNAIESKIDIAFSYSNKVCLKDKLQLSTQSNTIKGFIDEIFNDCPVQITERKNKILILPQHKKQDEMFVVSGYVRAIKDGEVLIGSSVYESKKWVGTTSNNFGYYSLKLPKGDVVINSSFVGYNSEQRRFSLDRDTTINFDLSYNALIKEIPVVGFIAPEGINTTRTSTINVPVDQIKKVPSFLGEVDVVKTLQLLPGINSGSEGVSGLYVRGGGVDQNLYLLDDVPVYNISHLFGFFSVFNADAINNVTITKGGFPARYGGRLSSVIDIRMKDGNNEKLKGTASIGMMSSKLALDGPLFNDKTTFSISLRRSYFDLFAIPIQSSSDNKTAFFFYDSSAKVAHKFSDKSKIFFSFYGGRDKFYSKFNHNEIRNPNQPNGGSGTINVNDESYSGWGNVVSSIRWNKVYNEKLFSNVSLAYSNYSYFVGYEEYDVNSYDWNYFEQKYFSGITDVMAKIDFDYFYNPKHHIRFGGNYTYHTFNPGVDIIRKTLNNETLVDSTIGGNNIFGKEIYFYLEDDFELTKRLKLNAGLHTSFYKAQNKTFSSWQPRISLRFLLSSKLALKAAYSEMTQYMHLLSSSSVSLPTDLWIPVTDEVHPQHADHFAVGAKWQWKQGFDISVEGFYKNYTNLVSYSEDSEYGTFSNSWENQLVYGDGYAKGIELLIHKKTGKFTGWFGYTLTKANHQFDLLNEGKEFPATNDRRHLIGIFGNYRFNERVDISATWAYGTGSAITLPSQKYYNPALPSQGTLQNNTYSEYINEINGYRMPRFHRLDVGANFKKQVKLGERIWSVGLYNAYGRQNAFSVYFDTEINESTGEETRELKQLSIFPVPLPYVRYTLKF
ncbi:TonB-dependent receptor [Labilibacter sediminis]|nr:TonB-dependent receptor [Labilibacter sediminis]